MLKPGMFISDRYEIIEKVGSGGMADVYKARCHRLNRFVAIKVLKSEYSDDKSFVLKFRGEAQSAAGLSHPNIVNVYDVGDDDGLYYIVMELVEGITLKNFIERKGKLEIKEAVGIAIQIAQGLEAAHDNHIIHRDIKPQNIIISKEGKVKVTDFGIAKAASSNTINSNAMGSVHYISPEQARGGYSDEKSDIYSLGITLYEMLSGMVPFAGDNTVSVALLHIQGEAMPLREIDPSIPLSLERIVQKCMEKKPERRYLRASELIADLKRSILNPTGDFVKVAAPLIDNSPTINISEEDLNSIKHATRVTPPVVTPRAKNNTNFDDLEIDEDSDVDPKLDKIFIIGSIVLTLILGIIVFIFVGKFLGFFGGGGSSVEPTKTPVVTIAPTLDPTANPSIAPTTSPEADVIMINVVGKKLQDALAELNALNLKPTYTEETSDEFELDYIITQSYEVGEALKPGTEVKLVVSAGKEAIAIPDNIINVPMNEAMVKLEDLGFVVRREYVHDPKIKYEYVVKTEPEVGSMLQKGELVTIFLSRGPEKTVMPNLIGMTRDDAKDALEDAGLVYGKAVKEFSSEYASGQVIGITDQSGNAIAVDAEVDKGTKVNVIISKGPEPTPEPTYEYEADIEIQSPFAEGVTSGYVELTVEYNGVAQDILGKQMESTQFPYRTKVSADGEGPGIIYIFVDGVSYGTQAVNFKKVQVN